VKEIGVVRVFLAIQRN